MDVKFIVKSENELLNYQTSVRPLSNLYSNDICYLREETPKRSLRGSHLAKRVLV